MRPIRHLDFRWRVGKYVPSMRPEVGGHDEGSLRQQAMHTDVLITAHVLASVGRKSSQKEKGYEEVDESGIGVSMADTSSLDYR